MSSIQRLPALESKKLIQSLKDETLFALRLACPYTPETSFLSDSDLGDMLAKVYGKHDGVMSGKYRRAQVFIFDFEGEKLVARCEKGDRGSDWSWIPKDQVHWDQMRYQVVWDTVPSIRPFFPKFICQLTQDLKLGDAPVHIFDEKAQAYLIEFMKAPLEKALPEARVSTSNPVKVRI